MADSSKYISAFCAALILTLLIFSPNRISSVSASSEPSFDEILNSLGFTAVAETTAETFPPGDYEITLYAEFTPYYDKNALGFYEVDTFSFNQIFAGLEGGLGYTFPTIKIFSANYSFGLSMLSPGARRYFTEIHRNPDGRQHATVYRSLDDSNMYLIGFENLYGAGDINHDCIVEINDVTIVCGSYASKPGDISWDPRSDIAKPYGFINILDVVAVTSMYGNSYAKETGMYNDIVVSLRHLNPATPQLPVGGTEVFVSNNHLIVYAMLVALFSIVMSQTRKRL